MRCIEIDGERIELEDCCDCPCFNSKMYCDHPKGKMWLSFDKGKHFSIDCPLREVKE